MTTIKPEQAFDWDWRRQDRGRGSLDPEPRLRGDILVWQVLTTCTPQWLFEIISTVWGLLHVLFWDLPMVFIGEPLMRRWRRWRKR